MSKVICQNCGSEVILPEKSSLVFGRTISKETKGDYILQMKANNNIIKEENKTMNNNNMNNGNGMNFDMEALAKMVAAQLSGQNIQAQAVVQNSSKVDLTKLNDSGNADKNHWAETSQFYGKEICGYAYNPYMIRRFLPAQFNQLMTKYNLNVHRGITEEYSYMYSILYTIEEVRKLTMLEKRDKIAFDERRFVFTLQKCIKIFTQYINDVVERLNKEANDFVSYNKVGKEYRCGIKGYGWVYAGVVSEKIKNHKVVKYLEKTEKFNDIFKDLETLKLKIGGCRCYKDLYKFVSTMNLIKVPADHKKAKEFMDCFIKAGAYYTLKQQLMFDNNMTFKGYSGRYAVIELRRFLERGTQGYIIYAMLKEANGLD